jgi:hypothetical protein
MADDGVVSAILTWVRRGKPERGLPREELRFRVGGMDSLRREHIDWLERELTVGDEVFIRVVDVRRVDAPLKGSRRPVDDSKRRQKAYVRRMAKEFGWKIIKR